MGGRMCDRGPVLANGHPRRPGGLRPFGAARNQQSYLLLRRGTVGISLELLVHRAAQGMHMQCTDLSIREVFGCSGLAGDNRTSMVPVALGSEVVRGEGPTVRL